MSEEAARNLERARALRAAGRSYREVGRTLGLSSGQLGHIRRSLKREKGARTRLLNARPDATARDLPIAQSVLPPGLRRALVAAGHRTLGELADRVADRDRPALEAIAGIGPYKARLAKALLDHYELLPGSGDLRAEIEALFPDLCD